MVFGVVLDEVSIVTGVRGQAAYADAWCALATPQALHRAASLDLQVRELLLAAERRREV